MSMLPPARREESSGPTPRGQQGDIHERNQRCPDRSEETARPPQEPLARAPRPRAERAPGCLLALFMWGHMFFVSSILIGKDAMWTITKFFEGYFFFGRSYPGHRVGRRRGVISHCSSCTRSSRCASSRSTIAQYRDVPRPHAMMRARGHDAVVLAGRHRLRAVLPRLGAPLHDADAPRPHRPVSNPPTASGATTGGRSTSCCCSRSSCTAASGSTASR